jgi:hypothetical protein
MAGKDFATPRFLIQPRNHLQHRRRAHLQRNVQDTRNQLHHYFRNSASWQSCLSGIQSSKLTSPATPRFFSESAGLLAGKASANPPLTFIPLDNRVKAAENG